MSNPSFFIDDQVPEDYKRNAQMFLLFIKKYYDWMYRKEGLSKEEVSLIRDNPSTYLDADIVSLATNNFSTQRYKQTIDELIIDKNITLNSGRISDDIEQDYMLESEEEIFITADDEYFADANDVSVRSHDFNPVFLDNWFRNFNFPVVGNDGLNRVDYSLLVSLLKHINAVKGTQKAIELFFAIFLNIDSSQVTVYIPKFEISTIDDNFVPDGTDQLRDDYYHDEYSYVIRTPYDPETYRSTFETIYLKYMHPAGFKVFLEQA